MSYRRRKNSTGSISDEKITLHFAEETGIHGIKPFILSKSACERFIWFIILMVGLACTARGTAMTIMNFVKCPTTTKMSMFLPNSFPQFAFCDTHFGTQERLEALGLDAEDYVALGRMFIMPQLFTYDYDNDTVEEMTLSHQKLMEKAGSMSMDDLLTEIADPPDIGMVVKPWFGTGEVFTERSLKLSGPCYLVQNNVSINRVNANSISFHVFLNRTESILPVSWTGRYRTLYTGTDAESAYFENGVALSVGLSYWVSLRTTRVKMLSTRDRQCAPWNTADFEDCFLGVIGDACIQKKVKPFFAPYQGLTLKDVASFGVPNETCLLPSDEELNDAITTRCPRPCESIMHDVSTTYIGHSAGYSDYVRVNLAHGTKSMLVEEKYTMTHDDFLSNLGGQISLWSGASLITVLQVVMFFAFYRRPKP